MYRMRVMTTWAAVLLVAAAMPVAAQEGPPGNEAPARNDLERTPPRLSFTDGEVSFWRPGAEDWTPAQVNTPLAPGDALYAGDAANLELEIGSRAYVRAGANTQLGVENEEPDFLQLKLTGGHASADLRSLAVGHTVEVDTPNAAFTIERTGYYRVDVSESATQFIVRRGGRATMIPANGEAVVIAPSEEVVVEGTDPPPGTDPPHVETYAAPELDDWDRWNYDRTDHLIDAVSARYVPPNVYGAEALDHYGSWRVVPRYGTVWVPQVSADWVPYSTGRWIWDPYYGWTWVDEAPWGWAPYHYGRWAYVDGFWAWAPGPVVVAPTYAPALVAFFGGGGIGVSIGIEAAPVGWVALGWGEPVIPWWGGAGFIGVPCWAGWRGPHVVNNVVVEQTTVVNVNNITYQNVGAAPHSVVAVRGDQFGHGRVESARLSGVDPHRLQPVHGALPVKPDPGSLVAAGGRANHPPAALASRPVVGTRAPHDTVGRLRQEGLNVSRTASSPAPRLVPRPQHPMAGQQPGRPAFGQQGTAERSEPSLPPRFQGGRAATAGGRSGAPAPERRVPAEAGRRAGPGAPQLPAQRPPAPAHGAPPAAAPGAPQSFAPPHQPPAAMRQQEAPRAPAPQRAERFAPPAAAPRGVPRSEAPRAERAAPAQAPRGLPGEPANRVNPNRAEIRAPRQQPGPRQQPAPHAAHAPQAPAKGGGQDHGGKKQH